MATRPEFTPPARPFKFEHDTFAFANELKWDYSFDDTGHWSATRREPPATYSHRCFVLARSARQFHLHAQFDPARPVAHTTTYAEQIARVVSRNPCRPSPPGQKVVIPGYPDLRTFSRAHEDLLKANCGGGWQSYVQGSHWRMIFPFSRAHQARTAHNLLARTTNGWTAVVHVVQFPSLAINHAIVLFDARVAADTIEFAAYDPNDPSAPFPLRFDRATRTFSWTRTPYFAGGRVDVNEIYRYWSDGPPPLRAPRQADCHRRKRQKNPPKKSRPQTLTPRM